MPLSPWIKKVMVIGKKILLVAPERRLVQFKGD